MNALIICVILTNLILCYGRPEVGLHYDPKFYEQEFHNNSLGKAHYNPWACDYRHEPGYTCLSCNRALHCYINNFALLVQCAGLFPYCRNGLCSMRKLEGCIEEPPQGVTTHSAISNVKKNTTTIAHTEHTTESIGDIEESDISNVNKYTTTITHTEHTTESIGDIEESDLGNKNKTVLSMEQMAETDKDEESATDKVMYSLESINIPDDNAEVLHVTSDHVVASSRMYYSEPPSSSLYKIIKSFLGILG